MTQVEVTKSMAQCLVNFYITKDLGSAYGGFFEPLGSGTEYHAYTHEQVKKLEQAGLIRFQGKKAKLTKAGQEWIDTEGKRHWL